MSSYIKEIFSTHGQGASSRKWMGFLFAVFSFVLALHLGPKYTLEQVYVLFLFVVTSWLFYGLTTVSQIAGAFGKKTTSEQGSVGFKQQTDGGQA